MPFVNERVSADDVVAYELDKIDTQFIVGGTRARDWTIDKDRGIYLRQVANDREEPYTSKWTLYWKGSLVVLALDNISTVGPVGGDRKGHKRIQWIHLPAHLEPLRAEVLNDLHAALTAYKDGGVYATATSYSLSLEVTSIAGSSEFIGHPPGRTR